MAFSSKKFSKTNKLTANVFVLFFKLHATLGFSVCVVMENNPFFFVLDAEESIDHKSVFGLSQKMHPKILALAPRLLLKISSLRSALLGHFGLIKVR